MKRFLSSLFPVEKPGGLPWRTLVFVWLFWAVAILGFQALATARLKVKRPDYARQWTASYTQTNSNLRSPYLSDPFMNSQVSFDSEYYLSIAVGGYEDPVMRRIPTEAGDISQNYAFYPFYPLVTRAVAWSLRLISLAPIGRATLAAVIVSLLGTLAGLVALYDLTRSLLDDQAAWRSSFYLLIFPSAVFFAMVYTEGLFIGLAFTSLALARRGKIAWAALLTIPALFTRAVGLLLIFPIGIAWLRQRLDFRQPLHLQLTRRFTFEGVSLLLPVVAYLAWSLSPMARNFYLVEEAWFGHRPFDLPSSIAAWKDAWGLFTQGHIHARILHGMEFASILLALVSSLWLLRRDVGLGIFCLLLLAVPSVSGSFQSMIRYMLVIPASYIFLAWLGRHPSFDRAWTILSTLLLGMEALLYAFDMWVA